MIDQKTDWFFRFSVRLGEWKISTDPDCDDYYCLPSPKDIPIESKIVHEKYDETKQIYDIALLKLQTEVEFTGTNVFSKYYICSKYKRIT